jgi:hypothetical protein
MGMEALHRFRLAGGKLKFEESSPRIAQGPAPHGAQISLDSKSVCLPCGGGNYGTQYGVYIYPVNSFKKTICTVQPGAYPRMVGFDPSGGWIFAQGHGSPLFIFSTAGVQKKSYKFDADAGAAVRQYLVHPAGNRLFMLTEKHLYAIDVPPR